MGRRHAPGKAARTDQAYTEAAEGQACQRGPRAAKRRVHPLAGKQSHPPGCAPSAQGPAEASRRQQGTDVGLGQTFASDSWDLPPQWGATTPCRLAVSLLSTGARTHRSSGM